MQSMKTIDFPYFIERYLANEMSDAEKVWFEKELDGNDNLRAELNLRKQTDKILIDQDVISLRNKLSEIEKRRQNAGKPLDKPDKINIRYSGGIYIRYAAVLAGIILIGSLIFLPVRTLSSDDIMKRYYRAYEPPTAQRSAHTAADADFTQALEFYNTHDYNKAAVLFTKVLESKPNDMETVLLNGVSNFEEKKYPEAKQSFGKVIDDQNNLFIDQAKWYLALCYVKTDETAKAKELLKVISREDGIYKKDAAAILKRMK